MWRYVSVLILALGLATQPAFSIQPNTSQEPPPPTKQQQAATETAGAPKGYEISYVKSNRKWRLGLRSEPYDKISSYIKDKLVEALGSKGIKSLETLDGPCCHVTIELLEVTSHPAMIKKPGVDVAATVAVTDAGNRQIYSKGFRGESRTVMNTWGHLINHACEELAKAVSSDENLIRLLTSGKL